MAQWLLSRYSIFSSLVKNVLSSYEFFSCALLCEAFRQLFHIKGIPRNQSYVLAWVNLALIVIPLNLANAATLFYPWDVPAAAFSLLTVLFARQDKPIPFLVLFALATLNRETSIALPLIFLVAGQGRTSAKVIAPCLLLWMTKFLYDTMGTGALSYSYHRWAGPDLLAENLAYIIAYPMRFFASVAFLPFLLCGVVTSLDARSRRLLIPLAAQIAAALVLGVAGEPRVFLESYVLSSYLVTVALWEMWQRRVGQRNQQY